jgi:hypothetical protein
MCASSRGHSRVYATIRRPGCEEHHRVQARGKSARTASAAGMDTPAAPCCTLVAPTSTQAPDGTPVGGPLML